MFSLGIPVALATTEYNSSSTSTLVLPPLAALYSSHDIPSKSPCFLASSSLMIVYLVPVADMEELASDHSDHSDPRTVGIRGIEEYGRKERSTAYRWNLPYPAEHK